MFHACVRRFDMTDIVINFLVTKQGLMIFDLHFCKDSNIAAHLCGTACTSFLDKGN